MKILNDRNIKLETLVSRFHQTHHDSIPVTIDFTEEYYFRKEGASEFSYKCRRIAGRFYEYLGCVKSAAFSYEKASFVAYLINKHKAKLSMKKKVLELKKVLGNDVDIAYAYLFLGDSYLDLNRIGEAEPVIKEGIELFKKNGGVPETKPIKSVIEHYRRCVLKPRPNYQHT